MLELDM